MMAAPIRAVTFSIRLIYFCSLSTAKLKKIKRNCIIAVLILAGASLLTILVLLTKVNCKSHLPRHFLSGSDRE